MGIRNRSSRHSVTSASETSESSSESYASYYDYDSEYSIKNNTNNEVLTYKLYQKYCKDTKKKVSKLVLKQERTILKQLCKTSHIKAKIPKKMINKNVFNDRMLSELGIEKKLQRKLLKDRLRQLIQSVLFLAFALKRSDIKLKSSNLLTLAFKVQEKCRIFDIDDIFRLKCTDLLIISSFSRKDCFIFRSMIHRIKLRCFYYLFNTEDETKLDKLYKFIRKQSEIEHFDETNNEDLSFLFKTLKYCGVRSLESCSKLTHKRLKQMGVDESSFRERIIDLFRTNSEEKVQQKRIRSSSESSFDIEEKIEKKYEVDIETVLRQTSLNKYLRSLKTNNVRTLTKAKQLTIENLRKFGIKKYSDREDLLKAFKEYEVYHPEVLKVLRSIRLTHYNDIFATFENLDACRKLNNTDLKLMGINYASERDSLLNVFKQSKKLCFVDENRKESNKLSTRPLEEVLIKCDLERYNKAFKPIRSLKEASKLNQSDILKLGVSMYTDRLKLINEFKASYKTENKKRKKLRSTLKI